MRYLVVGGGIAGICCVEQLSRLCPDDEAVLVSNSTRLKGVSNVKRYSSHVEDFEVVDRDLNSLVRSNLTVIQAHAQALDTEHKLLRLSNGNSVSYDKICICTGAMPKRCVSGPQVIVLRDQDTIEDLAARLQCARRIVLVGNGGIALELAHILRGSQVIWVLKHNHIGDAFFDYDAAAFLRTELEKVEATSDVEKVEQLPTATDIREEGARKRHEAGLTKRHLLTCTTFGISKGRAAATYSHAVGPQWVNSLKNGGGETDLILQTGCEVKSVVSTSGCGNPDALAVTVGLTNGAEYEADFVISACGVLPNTAWVAGSLQLDPFDKGILVNRQLEASVEGVYAAGDACTMEVSGMEQHFFQMRLWSQARLMGTFAAHSMTGKADAQSSGFNFELFTHVTRFLGKKVVLLGLYNGQRIPDGDASDLVSYSRSTEGDNSSFVRVLLQRGRLVGAVLIGDTGLEETFENLILDGLDLSAYGPDLLDPELDLDHLFD